MDQFSRPLWGRGRNVVYGEQVGANLGTGLRLAFAKEIVEAHGGKVTVKSKVGWGSTFRVYLPVASRPADFTFRLL
jgi:signal transduction histidine kinase